MGEATSDVELLHRHAVGDAEAFAKLARRHVDLVYSAARRRCGPAAEDVTQAVFLLLLQKTNQAARAAERPSGLAAWLLTATRNLANNANRRRRRREHHERKAGHMHAFSAVASSDPSAALAWAEIAPLLDDAVLSLPAADRAAILLKFYENLPAPEIADWVAISPDAARQRVSRAVGKLRRKLSKRGVEVPAATLAGLLAAHATTAAPVHLAATCAALTTGGTATAAALSLCQGTTMTTATILKLSAAAGIAAVGTGWALTRAGALAQQAATAPTALLPQDPVGPTAEEIDAANLPPDGAVVERTLRRNGMAHLDLDTGRVFYADDFDVRDQAAVRVINSAVDVYNYTSDVSPGLGVVDLAAVPVVASVWQAHPPPTESIASLWRAAELASNASGSTLDAVGSLPRTFLFRTDEGAGGILQIIRLGDDGALDLRYRILVRGEGRTIVSQTGPRHPTDPTGVDAAVEARLRAIRLVSTYAVHHKLDRDVWPEDFETIREFAEGEMWPESLPPTLTYAAPEADPTAPRIGPTPILFESVALPPATREQPEPFVVVGYDDASARVVRDADELARLLQPVGLADNDGR